MQRLLFYFKSQALFFLRLHANNESDLKQNKNELINLDHKVAAVYLAIKRNDTSIIEEYLIKTERNFILEKGQTTAGRGSEIPIQSFIDAIREIPKPS